MNIIQVQFDEPISDEALRSWLEEQSAKFKAKHNTAPAFYAKDIELHKRVMRLCAVDYTEPLVGDYLE